MNEKKIVVGKCEIQEHGSDKGFYAEFEPGTGAFGGRTELEAIRRLLKNDV